MKNTIHIASAALLALSLGSAVAQSTSPASAFAAPQNVAQLAATGSVEVQQDLLTITLSTTREGADANVVQGQLKGALDAALSEAKKQAQAEAMEVRTGNFSLYPRYGKEGRINGWQGSAELVLEGRDFARITSTAGKLQTLTVSSTGFNLSREARARVEGQAQALAIERFKGRATEIARSFGFGSYSLREVSINTNEQGYMPRPRMAAMEAKGAAGDASIPAEAGKSTVVVSVNGSVQMK